MIVNKENADQLKKAFTFPLILKQPDSAFSQGVKKVKNDEELNDTVKRMLDKSDLIIAQEFLPSPFDWRIGVIDRKPLYACKYYMANNHWQIIDSKKEGEGRYGNIETFDIKDVPPNVIETALKAANLIGDGLYGVDLKELDGKTYVIEVNDNPNLDAGLEDRVLKNDLYLKIMQVFLERLEKKRIKRD
jgi:glutathione synthase/RimK-type ligase-like ATP-grasp enzyme